MSNIVPESTDVMYSVSMNDTRLRWTSKVVGNSICAGQHISVSLEFYICMFTNMSKMILPDMILTSSSSIQVQTI